MRELVIDGTRRRVRVVHLNRANMLDALLSYQSAKVRRQLHPRRGEPLSRIMGFLGIDLDPGVLDSGFVRITRFAWMLGDAA